MNPFVTLSHITFDESRGEYALYFVENGPWPTSDHGWRSYLGALQGRILDVADAVIDGGLAAKYPESCGKRVRLQIDSPGGQPRQIADLVSAIRAFLAQDPTYREAIALSSYVDSFRVITGDELGRFGGSPSP